MRSRPKHKIGVLLLLMSVLFLRSAGAQVRRSASISHDAEGNSSKKPDGAATRLRAIVASGHLEDLRWPDFSDDRLQIVTFYRPSGYVLAWIRDGEATPQAIELIHVLQEADQEGLRAEDYDGSRWADRVKALHGDAEEARFDAALTVCIMRYVSDLHLGRINPQRMGFEFDVSHKRFDLPSFVRGRLVEGFDLRSELAAIAPPFPGYQRLRSALQHYMELEKSEDEERLLYPLRVVPGGEYAGVGRMAARLQLLGDLSADVTTPPDSKTYDGALVDAVKHFQGRCGLSPTGELDPKTMAEMNVPLRNRIEQMRLGLERYRWLPYEFKQPPIVVNVPEFRLYGFDDENRPDFAMKVNVGEEYDFQTPMFEKNILYIVFRPYWSPPPTILRKEIIPDLAKNPSLKENNLELVSASGQLIRAGNVTPAMLQQVRSGSLSVRQPPGPQNALGLVKFMFPNEHHVYIHDTPEGSNMFSEGDRAYSHGCIHAQEPARLAAWLLRKTPGWNLQRVESAMHEGRDNVRVDLASPVPLLIVYQTAVVEENGEVHFFHDIYGHDAALKEELAKGYPYLN